MQPPTDNIRSEVADRAFMIAEQYEDQSAAENALAELLDWIWEQIEGHDVAAIEDDEFGMASIESWLSVASYPVAVFYAPRSPFKRWNNKTLAGMAPKVTSRLRRITNLLMPHLLALAQKTSIDEVGVSYQFPWGFGGSAAWDVSQNAPASTYPLIRTIRYPAFTNAGHEFDIDLDEQTTVTAVSPK